MKLTIYYSGNPVAVLEEQGISCDPDLYPIPEYLEEMGFDPKVIHLRFAELETAIGKGETEIHTSDGAHYRRISDTRVIQLDRKYPMNVILSGGKPVGIHQPAMTSSIVAIREGYEECSVLAQWRALYPQAKRPLFRKPETHMLVMRDGCRLATDVYLPGGIPGPFSCVLIRTPYGKENAVIDALPFVLHGYAVAVQDVRGRHGSEGEWQPFYYETEDGDDTLTATSGMPWCNGRIGMFGASYCGYVQWAAAASGNPSLKTIVSLVTAGSAFADSPRAGGALAPVIVPWLALTGEHITDYAALDRDDWEDVLAHRPISEIFREKLGMDMPCWEEMLRHPLEDDFWKKGNWYLRGKEQGGQRIPALIETGWFDDDGDGSTEALRLTEDYPPELRKVIMGAWCHVGNSNYELGNVFLGENVIREDLDLCYYQWLEKHLQGREEVDTGSPVSYYTIGEGSWHSSDTWPPKGHMQRTYYLGEGVLTEQPGPGGFLSYEYDPLNPAHHLVDMSENENMLPADYSEEERREDYLLFTSDAFTEDTAFTGNALVSIRVGTDAPDTDFVVRLLKVGTDGRSVSFATGVLDLRFREGFSQEVFAEKGEIYPIRIETSKFSVMFKPGERLRLSVTSSAENLIFPNPNTREGLTGAGTRIARNQVFFGGTHGSCVQLSMDC